MTNNYNTNHLLLLVSSKFCMLNIELKRNKISYLRETESNFFETSKKKIENGTYIDDYFLDGNDNPKKEDIKKIISKISTSAIESIGYKFYTIYNVEKLNKTCANSLLKFIENPPEKTIGFLVTKFPNKVLNTIRSRSQILILPSKEFDLSEFINDDLGLSLDVLKSSFDSLEEIKFFHKSKNFKKIIELYHDIKKLKITNVNIISYLENFKKFSQNEITILLKLLYSSINNKKLIKVYELFEGNNININKTLLFNKILELN